jgi:hypothetical protein
MYSLLLVHLLHDVHKTNPYGAGHFCFNLRTANWIIKKFDGEFYERLST